MSRLILVRIFSFVPIFLSFSGLTNQFLKVEKENSLFRVGSFPPSEMAVEIFNLENINSPELDFCAIPYKNGVIFTSSRSTQKRGGKKKIFKRNYFDLFFTEQETPGHFTEPSKLEGEINGKLHDGMATFSEDGTKMFFSRNNKKAKGFIGLKIFSAELIEGSWSNIEELPFNNNKFSSCHPALSADGRSLYFASNRPGGFGGMDIYVAHFENGNWQEPQNLGAEINSVGNELFPFVNWEGTLFYSSDGLGGKGKLDIYASEKQGEDFEQSSNLGLPFNSAADDFGFFIDENKKSGYFSSNRIGGKGKDDIYSWNLKPRELPQPIFRKIIVKDQRSGKIISDAKVVVEQEKDFWETAQLSQKQGIYKLPVFQSNEYFLSIEKPGFEPFNTILMKEDLLEKESHVFYLTKKSISLFSGKVKDQINQQGIANVKIEIVNECTGQKQFVNSSLDGSFGFTLMCNCEYSLITKKEGFWSAKKIIFKEENNCETTQLLEKTIVLRPIPLGVSGRASAF